MLSPSAALLMSRVLSDGQKVGLDWQGSQTIVSSRNLDRLTQEMNTS